MRLTIVAVLFIFTAFSKRLPVCLYIKILVGDVTKMTSISDVRCGNNVGAVLDDLKHFLVSVRIIGTAYMYVINGYCTPMVWNNSSQRDNSLFQLS